MIRPLGWDARWYQISVLASLLLYGFFGLHFDVTPLHVAACLGSVVICQYAASTFLALPFVEYRSAVISGLSLSLLLRTDALWVAACTGFLTIASKFIIRVGGRHLFNPTNFGLAAAMLISGRAWISPGQWGSDAIAAFAFLCLGGMVASRALRNDVAVAFLVAYPGLLFFRAMRLGDPLSIPLHQCASGSLLLFTFFMISDPKTTPSSRCGRILFALIVASLAYHFRFRRYDPSALIWALALAAPAVPLLDRLFPAEDFRWENTVRRASAVRSTPSGAERSPSAQPPGSRLLDGNRIPIEPSAEVT